MMAQLAPHTTEDRLCRRIALRYWLVQILAVLGGNEGDQKSQRNAIRQAIGKRKKLPNLLKLGSEIVSARELCSPADGRNLMAFPMIANSRPAKGLNWKLETRYFTLRELTEEALNCVGSNVAHGEKQMRTSASTSEPPIN